MTHITRHAIDRFRERIADIPEEQIRARLDTPAVRLALRIGAPFVKLGSGHRLVVRDNAIISVLDVDHKAKRLNRGFE